MYKAKVYLENVITCPICCGRGYLNQATESVNSRVTCHYCEGQGTVKDSVKYLPRCMIVSRIDMSTASCNETLHIWHFLLRACATSKIAGHDLKDDIIVDTSDIYLTKEECLKAIAEVQKEATKKRTEEVNKLFYTEKNSSGE